MEFLIADEKRMELGQLTLTRKLDFELGSNENCNNDFELKIPYGVEQGGYGQYIFCPGTEYGGIIEELGGSTKEGTIAWRGNAWRGLLRQSIIEPPSGMAYLSVSGEANTVIANIMDGRLGGLFDVSAADSGLTVSYQFDRYTSVLDGLSKMLKSYHYKLRIWTERGEANEPFGVHIEAVPVTNYAEEIEYSQNNRVNMTIEDYRRGINHLICLGRGELTDRQVLHLYVDEKGNISTTKSITGLAERVAILDYSSAESTDDLHKSGVERLTESMNYKKMNLEVEDVELEIGDIIAGKDRETGASLAKPIVQKILTIEGLTEKISYKVEGEE